MREIARQIPVTVDVIEIPQERPQKIVFVVYEDQVMPMEKHDRQILMAKLESLQREVRLSGLDSEIIGRPGKPDAL